MARAATEASGLSLATLTTPEAPRAASLAIGSGEIGESQARSVFDNAEEHMRKRRARKALDEANAKPWLDVKPYVSSGLTYTESETESES